MSVLPLKCWWQWCKDIPTKKKKKKKKSNSWRFSSCLLVVLCCRMYSQKYRDLWMLLIYFSVVSALGSSFSKADLTLVLLQWIRNSLSVLSFWLAYRENCLQFPVCDNYLGVMTPLTTQTSVHNLFLLESKHTISLHASYRNNGKCHLSVF